MRQLSELQNIGKTIEQRLNKIGIHNEADLRKIGSIKAFKMIRETNPDITIPVCYYLYSLEGALLDLHWDDLPKELKKTLKKKALA